MEKLVSFENCFFEGPQDNKEQNPDVLASITIDGYPEDINASGEVVAVVYITQHGDIITSWHDNAYSLNEYVLELVEDSKKTLIDYFDNNRPENIVTQYDIRALRILLAKCQSIIKTAEKCQNIKTTDIQAVKMLLAKCHRIIKTSKE